MTETITFIAEESENLDTTCYRGSAPLKDLALISQADVFDQETNPKGLQRELSRKHAAEAYDYVAREPNPKLPRAFPEIAINARDRKVVTVEPITEVEGFKVVRITVDVEALQRSPSVKVSRMDGNHRLFFGAGDGDNREPIGSKIPFQLHIGLNREQEASLFADINANAKGMNTSHLAVLRSRLTPDEIEVIQRPWRTFAMRLTTDEASPFKGMIHMGGSKAGSKKKDIKHVLTFVALENAVKRLMGRSQHLQELSDTAAQYALVRAYWQAVQMTWPEAFDAPADYLLTKGLGVGVLAQLGGIVVDRSMIAGNTDAREMSALLAETKGAVDWHKNAPTGNAGNGVGGMSGNRAILLIAGQMADSLPKLARST